jgi:hypothetical protein
MAEEKEEKKRWHHHHHSPALAGTMWFIGWLFTIGYAHLVLWQIFAGIVIWPYFLGRVLGG